MDEYKEAASRVADRVKEGASYGVTAGVERASQVKAAAMDWFGQFTAQQ